MGLFSRFSGTRSVDQFVLHHSKSLADQEFQYRLSSWQQEGLSFTPDELAYQADAVKQEAAAQVERMNADIRAARLNTSKRVAFLNEEGRQIGRKVSGRKVAKQTNLFAIPDDTLMKYGLAPVEDSAAHHITYSPGSRRHTGLIKMLVDEGFSEDVIQKARLSEQFIFFHKNMIFGDTTRDMTTEIFPTKTAFHEMGHAFSHQARRNIADPADALTARINLEINKIKSLAMPHQLFEKTSVLDEFGRSVEAPSILENIKSLQTELLNELAKEEARAEGFSHGALGLIRKEDLPHRLQLRTDSETLLDEYVSQGVNKTKQGFLRRAKEINEDHIKRIETLGEVRARRRSAPALLNADEMPGETLRRLVSYSEPKDFKGYSRRTTDKLQDVILKKFGPIFADSKEMKDYLDDLNFEARTSAHRTFLHSIDSPVIDKLEDAYQVNPIKSLIGRIERGAIRVGKTAQAKKYVEKMGDLIGVGRSAELTAHAAMSKTSILPALAEDANIAASSVVESVSDLAEIASTATRKSVNRILIGAGRKPSGSAVIAAARSSTSSKIISGVKTAMKLVGTAR